MPQCKLRCEDEACDIEGTSEKCDSMSKWERGWCMKCGEEGWGRWRLKAGGVWEHRFKTTSSRVWFKAKINKCNVFMERGRQMYLNFFPSTCITLGLQHRCSSVYLYIWRTQNPWLTRTLYVVRAPIFPVWHFDLVQSYSSADRRWLHKGQPRWTWCLS